ncbi:hypothetical protein COX95_02775 [bacterium CG_4_10_14_0_2_um_filter_33_32]|nr:MAG: hypothetical protein AUJ93_01060 [bacterium CG2_30_33_46]PIU76375.1 MAG: hypothetical protein COS74_04330 [bacterium CG06_land_8_20_14_3_00_33_50]PIW81261.1 MAG: hypothetical protein COZ97_02675 [bacterium CG_4_8_14_3_um_filter_33_28]PIY85684.1 MAG: hypothetical protein COY76_00855 [bacterium CG_4_10_14_0_8_um_filter_33_57]PIZ85832.1 MAG: hypothetical protein COX95_02775 [bacterium CG_4_10_14_0_2_um_filter_33_32]PJA72646.1 MAG: hypothetical protein CO152_00305 [bacterium CG_4_9_14_3_um
MSIIKKHFYNNLILFFACTVVIVSIFLVGTFLYFDIFYVSKFFPRTEIAGIRLDGKTKGEVQDLITSKIQEWSEQKTEIKSDDKNWQILNKDFGLDFDIDKTIENTFQKGRKGNLSEQFINRLSVLFFGVESPLFVTKNSVDGNIKKISEEADIDAVNVGLKIENGLVELGGEKIGKEVNNISLKYLILENSSYLSKISVLLPQKIVYPNSNENDIKNIKKDIEEILGSNVILNAKSKTWTVKVQEVQDWLTVESRDKDIIAVKPDEYKIDNYLKNILESFGITHFLNENLEIKLKSEKVTEYLNNIANQINETSINASLGIDNSKVVVKAASRDGEELDIKGSLDEIINSFKKKENSINLPVKKVLAKVKEDNIEELGIVELIGKGESDFSGSSAARKNNVKVGASKFNGLLIAPGEEFSFNKYLGEVDASTGFLPELVIKPGKMIKEYGGGLCQVATTAFRAALYSGFPITERKNHSFAVHYYYWPFDQAGVDATIYPPHPDLRFKNDSGKYILIQTYSSGNRLTFDFYGTKGSRRVEVNNPQVIERGSNGSLKTVFSRTIYKGDQLIKKDDFYSFYKPASEFPATSN